MRVFPTFVSRTSNADRTHSDYSLPIDGEEQDRLDMTHHGYKILLDGNLFIAPFEESPAHVLDIGTGMRVEWHFARFWSAKSEHMENPYAGPN